MPKGSRTMYTTKSVKEYLYKYGFKINNDNWSYETQKKSIPMFDLINNQLHYTLIYR